MLHIANEEQKLQYALFQEGSTLAIKLGRDYARTVASEVATLAYKSREPITRLDDVRMLGEFIPYRDSAAWGYCSCLHVEALDKDTECWKIEMPSWHDHVSPSDAFVAHLHAVYTLDAVFAALNVLSEGASLSYKQRVEISFSHDYCEGTFSLKAELSSQAVSKLMFLNRGEHRDITDAMREVFARMTSINIGVDDEAFYSLLENDQILTVGIPGAELEGRLTSAGGCLLVPRDVSTTEQVLTLLTGLAVLDDLLSDLVPPHL